METSELDMSCENIGTNSVNQDNNSEMDYDNRFEMYMTSCNAETPESLDNSDTGCVFKSHIPQTRSADFLSTNMTNSPKVNNFKNSYKTKNQFSSLSKLLYNKIRKQSKAVSGICNLTTSELPPLPISLVMTHPAFEFMEIRLPLLHTFTDSTTSTTHTVIDEHGLLEGQQLKYKQPLSKIDVIIRPANEILLEELKHSLSCEDFQLKMRQHCNQTDHIIKEKVENLHEMAEKECSLLFAPDSIKQDIIFQTQDAVDNLMNKRNDFSGVNCCTLPPGKLLIGRSSSGEWLISRPQPNKTVKFKGTRIQKWPRKENLPQEKPYLDSVKNMEKEKAKAASSIKSNSPQKDTSSSSFICIENCSSRAKGNPTRIKETIVKEDKTQNYPPTIGHENQIDTIDTIIQPIPVMMMCNEGESLKVIHVPFKTENQLVEENNSYHSNTCQNIESEGTIKVKEEPVDTGYDTGQTSASGKDIQDENSPLIVRFSNLKQFGSKEIKHTSSSTESKVGQKRKSTEDDPWANKKCISLNHVPLKTDLVTDNSSYSEEKASTSLLEDNYSDSEEEDSETSRSGQESSGIRFPVMNDGEIDALMDIETTRGTKRQTRWGVRKFKEWLKKWEFDPNFEDLSIKVLDERLEKFYAELRTADGKLYATNSFGGIRASINRHLTTDPYNRSLSLFTDPAFHKSNKVFKAIMLR
ncbi:uncharacterized protein LOC127730166 isoform X2 [Mytilus californianus]|uniref:uncharacterized protein LOC127730166 isoform X2 n=1 Tax=Mytilus californianus TaxID=6549 RepID=UPI0022458141|nr:uncharacterized protein LOC127730166 isoform X2 [Mytilus californianus]